MWFEQAVGRGTRGVQVDVLLYEETGPSQSVRAMEESRREEEEGRVGGRLAWI